MKLCVIKCQKTVNLCYKKTQSNEKCHEIVIFCYKKSRQNKKSPKTVNFVIKSCKLVKKNHQRQSFCYPMSQASDKKVTKLQICVIRRHHLVKNSQKSRKCKIFYKKSQHCTESHKTANLVIKSHNLVTEKPENCKLVL